MKKGGAPERGELVICRITKIHPNSAFAELIEYDKTGMIHVSEVALRWVKNIREFLKENQYVVCRVMRIDPHQVELSVKRVRPEEATAKLNEFKRERKSEKMLELAAKGLKKTLEQAHTEVGEKLFREFGSLTKAMDIALKNPDLLKSKGIPKNWADALSEIANKGRGEKTYAVTAELELACYSPDGVDVIKRILSGIEKKGLEVRYISAPKYAITGRGGNFKQVEADVEKAAELVVREIKQNNGEGSFKIEEK